MIYIVQEDEMFLRKNTNIKSGGIDMAKYMKKAMMADKDENEEEADENDNGNILSTL